ncbi:11001_t:CDS:2 [Entrophospora sp. SA101]|nr:11001_t:CDS:2 [Entrophospora sp. SA101]
MAMSKIYILPIYNHDNDEEVLANNSNINNKINTNNITDINDMEVSINSETTTFFYTTIPDLSLPTSMQDVKNQAIILHSYSNNSWRGYLHILFVLSFIYIWKQAFSIPGALFLNLLAGAMYGPMKATLFTCLLTSIGASVAYLLSKFVGKPFADFYLLNKLINLRKQVDENRENLFYYLLFIRMFPLSPWWLLNITSPLLSIPIGTFFITMFFGSIPYNLACCQSGDIISELNSTTDMWQPTVNNRRRRPSPSEADIN